jgi:hypothetical protein
MATSGTTSFNETCSQLILDAARKVRAVRGNATGMPAGAMVDWRRALNSMVKRWQAKGLHVWTVSEGALFPQVETVTYDAGAGATAHVTQSYVQTELVNDAAAGAGAITVDSAAGIADGDNIGIGIDDGSIQWTTVNGAPVGGAIALDAVLTSAADAASPVFAYADKIAKPIRVVSARRHSIATANDVPIDIIARADYYDLPQKTQAGTISRLMYDRQLSTGIFKLWQPPNVVDDIIEFTWWRPIEDFNAGGDSPDLPQEWINPLMEATSLDDMIGFDREGESIFFGVDMAGR